MSSEPDHDQSLAPPRDPLIDRVLTDELRTSAASSSCVDAETFAAWADGALTPGAAEAVESHIADCAACQAMMSAFVRTEPVAAVILPFWRRSSVRWMVPLVVGSLAAAALIAAVWSRREPVPAPAQTMARVEVAPPAPPMPTPQRMPTLPTPREASATHRAAPAPATSPKPPAAATNPALDMVEEVTVQEQVTKPPASPNRAGAGGQAGQGANADRPVGVPAQAPPATASAAGALASLPLATRNALNFVEFLPGVDAAANHNQRDSTVMGLPQSAIAITIDGVSVQDQVLKSSDGFFSVIRPQIGLIAEFQSPDPSGAVVSAAAGGGGSGRGGGAARAGGGGRAAAGAASAVGGVLSPSMRWRLLASGVVQKSPVGSDTWEPITIDPPAVTITNGAAPSPLVCWLIGRAGIVLRASDGLHFSRVTFPEIVDLASIRASDANIASITTTDSRVFTTTDGGQSWHQGLQGF